MKTEFPELTSEESLFGLYRKSFRFPINRFNYVASLFAILIFSIGFWLLRENYVALAYMFRKVADIGLTFATTVLGFLIAGFTIFVTVTKSEIFLTMATTEFGGTKESWLKFTLTSFMLVFAHYVAFVFVCLLINLVFQPGGVASAFISQLILMTALDKYVVWAKVWVLVFVDTCLCTWSLYLVLLLKSFVFNTYAMVTIVVRTELERIAKGG